MPHTTNPIDLTPAEVRAAIDSGDAVLIDVREPFEHAEASIRGAHSVPLAQVDPSAILEQHAGRTLILHCKAGGRSAQAARRFPPDTPVHHLAGGIDAWSDAGFPIVRAERRAPIPIMRQVQITAGTLVAAGTALGAFVSPWFLAVPAFVGCGLVFAGASGWCGMAKLLAVMPWNPPPARSPAGPPRAAPSEQPS